jgi:hypothetical protein
MNNPNYFIELYIECKRLFYDNKYLKPPKVGSNEYNCLVKASQVVDEMHGEYSDFILTQARAFGYYHKFPEPYQLVSDQARQRYHIHQSRKNRYNYEYYSVDGDYITIKPTGKTYSVNKISKRVEDDDDASFIMNIIDRCIPHDNKYDDLIWYIVVKYMYRQKRLPQEIETLWTRVRYKNVKDTASFIK